MHHNPFMLASTSTNDACAPGPRAPITQINDCEATATVVLTDNVVGAAVLLQVNGTDNSTHEPVEGLSLLTLEDATHLAAQMRAALAAAKQIEQALTQLN